MNQYIDGFAFPILKTKLKVYKEIAEKIAEIWKVHGAINYKEFVSDGLEMQGTLSFNDLLKTNERECVIFGWLTFESKEARDLAHKKVASDIRMNDLIQPLLAPKNPIFDAQKMAFGGFQEFIAK